MEIVLLRHFHSLGNEDGSNYRKYGNDYVPLSEKGVAQAADTAAALDALLEKHGITQPDEVAIWCSPYTRTQETLDHTCRNAQHPALKGHGLESATLKDWLREIHVGNAMDLTSQERATLYPNHQARFTELSQEYPSAIKYPYGETPFSRYEAVSNADIIPQFAELKARGVKLVLCVSHQLNINAIRAVLRNEEPDEIMRGPMLGNGGLLTLTMDDAHRFGEPSCAFGSYERSDLSKMTETTPLDIEMISPVKRIEHTVMAAANPEGLLAAEPGSIHSGPEEIIDGLAESPCPVTSYVQRVRSGTGSPESDKSLRK